MIWTVFKKELKELLRDRKHLLVTILLPILVTPLMMFGVGALQVRAEIDQAQQTLKYVLIENVQLEGFRQRLAESELFEDVRDAIDYSELEAMENGELDFFIQVNQEKKQYFVNVEYKATVLAGSKIERLQSVVDSLAMEIVSEDLYHYGVYYDEVEAFLNPIVLNETNLVSKQENVGQVLGGFLPFLIVLWMISSAVAISSDLVAGEKERGTLETLIISPVPLLAMLVGKWMTVTLSAWIAGVITLVSLWLSGLGISLFLDSNELFELVQVLSPLAISLGVVMMLPTAGLVSAIFLVSGSIAHSFKEAQSYASGLMILFFVPLFATLSGTIELTFMTSLIPIANASLAFTEMLKGTLSYGYIVPIVIANSVLIFAVLTVALALYRSESVLTRQ